MRQAVEAMADAFLQDDQIDTTTTAKATETGGRTETAPTDRASTLSAPPTVKSMPPRLRGMPSSVMRISQAKWT